MMSGGRINGPSDPPSASPGRQKRRRLPLHIKIFVGLVIGATLGVAAHSWGVRPPFIGVADARDDDSNGLDDRLDKGIGVAEPIGKVFLRLIFMVVVPLVFSALVLGVVGMGNVAQLGRVGGRTLLLTVVLSTIAVAIGVTLVNVLRPGGSLNADQREALRAQYADDAAKLVQKAKQAKRLRDTLLDIIPENPLQEMVGAVDGSSKGNGMLAVMFFSLALGVALTQVPKDRSRIFIGWLEGLFDACMVVIGFAMRLAPYAVVCLMFVATAKVGPGVLKTLVGFILAAFLGLSFHLIVVYSAVLRVAGVRPREFFRHISEAMLTAFGTSSSNATLPTALKVAREDLRLPPEIARFVLTVGATGNQNGTALYEGVVVLFLAQLFGVELSLWQQCTVVLMSVLAGVGTAGVPGGSLPLIVIVLQSVGVPGEGIGIILGVDRILDMCRTVVNVTGDLTIAACVSRWEDRRSAKVFAARKEPVT